MVRVVYHASWVLGGAWGALVGEGDRVVRNLGADGRGLFGARCRQAQQVHYQAGGKTHKRGLDVVLTCLCFRQ